MVEKPCSMLIIKKLAACLRIPKSGLFKIVLESEIPCQKLVQSRLILRLRPAPLNILLRNQLANR